MTQSTTGSLTTHVLDTARGCPATAIKLELWRITPGGNQPVTTQITNGDGCTDTPLLMDETMAVGLYELRFWVGDYFANQGLDLPDPPFLDQIPIRFAIADRTAHYHVPLLVSPWSYSTYRGS